MKNKNILILIPEIKNYGGMVFWGRILGNNLRKNKYKINYLTIYNNGNFIDFNKDINYFHFKPSNIPSKNYIIKIYYIIKIFFEFINLKKKIKPDIIISGGSFLNIINILGKTKNIKSIISIHSNIYSESKINFFIQKIIYNFADHIVTINNEEKKNLVNNLKLKQNKITTIYSSINKSEINILKDEEIEKKYKSLFNNGKKTFIHIGRLSKEKNHKFLLKIFNEFNKNNPNSQLILLGEGIEKEDILKYKESLGCKNNIHFLLYQKNIYNFLYKSDFLIMCSYYEGFPISFIEAMSLGIPIISHDFKTGAKECIRQNNDLSECTKVEIHENGILIPYMDENKFIEGLNITTSITFDKEKIKENSIIFNIDNNIKQWIQIIEETK